MNKVDKLLEEALRTQTQYTMQLSIGRMNAARAAKDALRTHLEAMEADRVRLLEALKNIISEVTDIRGVDVEEYKPVAFEQARAAIAQSEAQS
jgi:hypothetical protein